MNSFKTVFATILLVALAAGYGMSQWAFFTGTYATYSAQIDQPLVRWVALIVIVGCVASAFFGNDNERSEN